LAADNLSLFIAAGAGLLSFASPCVVPLVPGYLGYLSGTTVGVQKTVDEQMRRASQRRRVLAHALAFVLGFTLVFTALGASVGLIGYAVRDFLPYIQKAGGLVLIAFGLHAMGVITLPLLYREMRLDARIGPQRWGYLSSVIIGAIFGAGWTPCVGVVLSGILTLAAASATVSKGAGLLLAYSLGLGVDGADTPANAQAYIKEFGITYPNGPDIGTKAAQAYRIQGVPETYYVDRRGYLRGVQIGPLKAPELDQKIDELLADKP
jgi:cytochrome c-type biogenesis protein